MERTNHYCDWCGGLIPDKSKFGIRLEREYGLKVFNKLTGSSDGFELCDECARSFKKLIKARPAAKSPN